MYFITVHAFQEWRLHARELLRRNVPPDQIQWQQGDQHVLDFGSQGSYDTLAIQHKRLVIPKAFIDLAERVACYRGSGRWALLYCLAWRVLFENRGLMSVVTDTQVHEALRMRKAVNRDRHKMKAFVRFRRINLDNKFANNGRPATDQEHYLAWFEPSHLILPITTDFFVSRFSNMNWSILTPDACAYWDQQTLIMTEGFPQNPNIDDEIEKLWLTYYANIFNPSRLKTKAMQAEMPKKYWLNLPEAAIIKDLIRTSTRRMEEMLDQAPSPKWYKKK